MTAVLSAGQVAYLRTVAEQVSAQPPALTSELETAMIAAASMLPEVLAELDRVRSQRALACAEYAGLLQAVRAAVAADRAGSPDPLGWVRHLLGGRGQLPGPAAVDVQVAADAATALQLAGWPS
jgi:hypothetical protein